MGEVNRELECQRPAIERLDASYDTMAPVPGCKSWNVMSKMDWSGGGVEFAPGGRLFGLYLLLNPERAQAQLDDLSSGTLSCREIKVRDPVMGTETTISAKGGFQVSVGQRTAEWDELRHCFSRRSSHFLVRLPTL